MVNWKIFWQKEGKKEQSNHYIKVHLSIAKDIEKVIRKHNYTKIIDFGCGPSLIIKQLAKKYPEKQFTGYDLSDHIIKQNMKTKLKNLHFKVADLNKITANKKFDLVLSLSTLHYFIDPIQKIRELLRLVDQNGSLIVNYPNKQNLKFYYKKGEKLDYWKNRLKLMFEEKNLITLKQIKQLGYGCKIIREKQSGNKYIQILK